MDELTLPLTGLSPVLDKEIIARFDGGTIFSDGGLLVLRGIERRTGLATRLAACLDDPRDPSQVQHTLADMIACRILMIAAGYENANDGGALRRDPDRAILTPGRDVALGCQGNTMTNGRILVTGADVFIGSNRVERR